MGSCISTIATSHPPKSPNAFSSKIPAANRISKSPPPLPEEETVKEVLSSESPSIPHNPPPVFSQNYLNQIQFACEQHRRRNGADFTNPLRLDKHQNDVVGNGKFHETPRKKAGGKSDPKSNQIRPGFGYWRRHRSGEGSERRMTRSVVMGTCSGSDPKGSHSRSKEGTDEETRKAADEWPPTSNELLENPTMALECFIFL